MSDDYFERMAVMAAETMTIDDIDRAIAALQDAKRRKQEAAREARKAQA